MTDVLDLRQTKDMGTCIKPGPSVVAAPAQVVTDDDFAGVGASAGLNGPFLADLLAAFAAHENLGTNMYRAFTRGTDNPMLASRFKQFEADARAAVRVYRTLIEQLGSRWGYISPAARMTEALDSKMQEAFLLAGSAPPAVVDMKRVDATLLASTACVAHTAVLANVAASLDDGDEVRTALETTVAALEGPQQQHLEWAAETQMSLAVGQARSAAYQLGNEAVGAIVHKVKDVAKTIKDTLT